MKRAFLDSSPPVICYSLSMWKYNGPLVTCHILAFFLNSHTSISQLQILRACIVNYWVTVYLTPPHSCLYELRHLPRMSLLAPDNGFKGERRQSSSYLPQTKSKHRQRRTKRNLQEFFPGISPLTSCQTRKCLLLSSVWEKVKGALENTWRWENCPEPEYCCKLDITVYSAPHISNCHKANLDSQMGTVTGDRSCDRVFEHTAEETRA